MAIQIFDQTPSFGERLGQALGTGLGGLAADYNAKQAANKYKQSLIPYFGKDISNLIANASPEERKFLLQNVDSLLEMDRRRKEGAVNEAIDNQSPFQQALNTLQQGQQGIEQYIGKAPNVQGLDVFNELMNQKNKMLGLPSRPTTTAQTIDDMIAQAQRQKEGQPLLDQYKQAQQMIQQQMRQPAQIQMPQQQDQGQFRLFENPQTRLAREQFEFNKQKEARKMMLEQEATNKPFFDKHNQDLKEQEQVQDYAQEALRLLRANKKKFPKGIARYTPEMLLNDPNVREYVSNLNNLVIALSQSRKGIPTNFKIKLEQAAKPNITQPLDTQEKLLEKLVERSNKPFLRQQLIEQIKEENGGQYPRNIELIIKERESKQKTKKQFETVQQLLSTLPADAQEGELFQDDVTGVTYRYQNGTLVEV